MVKYKDSDPEKWMIKEHTKVKHDILSLYLVPWAKILRSFNKRLIILDGFAGRGEYTENGQKIVCGSPIIFMDLNLTNLIEDLVCIYVEKDHDNYSNLCEVLRRRKNDLETRSPNTNMEIIELISEDPIQVNSFISYFTRKYGKSNTETVRQKSTILLINADFVSFIESTLSHIDDNNMKIAPSFCFIDPFGFHGIPLKIIKRILSLPNTEILLTFMARDINRFSPLEQEEKGLEQLFGTKEWKKEIDKKDARKFADFYRRTLKSNGVKFVIYFRMFEANRKSVIYYLIHASNDLKAVELMKERMKKINVDFTYYGPDNNILDNKQERLTYGFEEYADELCEQYSGKKITFDELREETIDSNSFIEKEYRQIIKQLEMQDRIKILRVDSKRSGIKGRDEINFL